MVLSPSGSCAVWGHWVDESAVCRLQSDPDIRAACAFQMIAHSPFALAMAALIGNAHHVLSCCG